MKPLIIISLALAPAFLLAQSVDSEIDRVARLLTTQFNGKQIKRIAVVDFEYQGQPNTRIGAYLADELSLSLTMNGGTFDVMNRDKVRQEMQMPQNTPKTQVDYDDLSKKTADAVTRSNGETKQESQADIIIAGGAAIKEIFKNPKKKKFSGVDVIVFGTIEDRGDYLRLIINASRNNSTADNAGAARANFVKSPEIRDLLNGGLIAAPQYSAPGSPGVAIDPAPPGTTAGNADLRFKFENLNFEVVSCRQSGREIECKLNILSTGKDDVTHANFDGTRIIDANGGFEFHVNELQLADVNGTSGWGIEKALVANFPIECVLRFTNVDRHVESIARLELNFWSHNASNFTAKIYNVPVR